ncbi:MAG TPA: protein kinase [Methylomirabilota bacterium]|nr:protein kinase [Methylomirabilota bacterium]
MNPTREELLFGLALTKPAAELVVFLDRECAGDSSLRQRLEALLAAHEEPDGVLPTQAESARPTIKLEMPDEPADEAMGQTLGRYKLLEKVGEGGCGVVYVAEQTEPVRRRVALKVIKLGMDTKAVVARFEAERQALAMMDHPNIAKVLDAGTTGADTAQSQISDFKSPISGGRPYFVMELVRGIKITDYCDQHNLTTKERLDLFIKVCQAIQHAHQKGIIHRDIKPSNILVTLHDGVPVPKVIDFGIAKATEGRLTDNTVYTQLHQFIGTPAYMSPEQAEMSGLDIDTRSDIYSLGVLLYELLTGKTPFDGKELMSMGLDAMRRTIREQEPVRPSTRLATLAADQLTTTAKCRSADTSKLLHQLKGDLDWIVMKCLEKDRTHRYETANGLAADIKRHLNNEPVVARPPNPAYRFQKAWRRNKLVFASGAAVLAALVVGIGFSTWQASVARQANRESIRARAEKEEEARIAQQERDRALAAQTLADAKTREAQLNLYAADMKLAHLALDEHDLKRAMTLLERHRPAPGAPDLRGFEWRYLWKQTRSQDIASMATSNGIIRSLAFSPDNRWLAVAGSSGASVIHVAGWTEQIRLEEKTFFQSVHFSPGGESLLTGSPSTGLRIWDTLTWRLKRQLDDVASYGAFSPDGRLIIGGSPEGLRIWDSQSLRHLHHLTNLTVRLQWSGKRGPMGSLGFSSDGRVFAAAIEDSSAAADPISIRTWNVTELRERGPRAAARSIQFPEVASVLALALNDDGTRLAVSTTLGSLSLWDVTSGERLAVLRAPAPRWTSLLHFRPGHEEIIGARMDGIPIWRYENGTLNEIEFRRGHVDEPFALATARNGSRFATGDGAGTVKLWDASLQEDRPADNGASRDLVPGHMSHLHFLADNRSLVANEFLAERLNFWDTTTGQRRRTFSNVVWHAGARVSPDERWILLARTNGLMELREVTSQTLVATLRGHTNEVRRIFFTPDSRKALTATVQQLGARGDMYAGDVWVRLWDIPSGRLIQETALAGTIRDLVLAPDGSQFAVLLPEGRCEVRQTGDLTLDYELPSGSAPLRRLAWSPDGSTLVACWDLLHFWDLPTRSLRLGSGRGYVWIGFAPDGRTVVTYGGAREMKLVNMATGQEMLSIPLGAEMFQSAFNRDGTILAAGTYRVEGSNRTYKVLLLRAPSLAEIATLEAGNLATRH